MGSACSAPAAPSSRGPAYSSAPRTVATPKDTDPRDPPTSNDDDEDDDPETWSNTPVHCGKRHHSVVVCPAACANATESDLNAPSFTESEKRDANNVDIIVDLFGSSSLAPPARLVAPPPLAIDSESSSTNRTRQQLQRSDSSNLVSGSTGSSFLSTGRSGGGTHQQFLPSNSTEEQALAAQRLSQFGFARRTYSSLSGRSAASSIRQEPPQQFYDGTEAPRLVLNYCPKDFAEKSTDPDENGSDVHNKSTSTVCNVVLQKGGSTDTNQRSKDANLVSNNCANEIEHYMAAFGEDSQFLDATISDDYSSSGSGSSSGSLDALSVSGEASIELQRGRSRRTEKRFKLQMNNPHQTSARRLRPKAIGWAEGTEDFKSSDSFSPRRRGPKRVSPPSTLAPMPDSPRSHVAAAEATTVVSTSVPNDNGASPLMNSPLLPLQAHLVVPSASGGEELHVDDNDDDDDLLPRHPVMLEHTQPNLTIDVLFNNALDDTATPTPPSTSSKGSRTLATTPTASIVGPADYTLPAHLLQREAEIRRQSASGGSPCDECDPSPPVFLPKVYNPPSTNTTSNSQDTSRDGTAPSSHHDQQIHDEAITTNSASRTMYTSLGQQSTFTVTTACGEDGGGVDHEPLCFFNLHESTSDLARVRQQQLSTQSNTRRTSQATTASRMLLGSMTSYGTDLESLTQTSPIERMGNVVFSVQPQQ